MRFRQFKLLMWKNYRWRRYFWIWTLIEALVPIFIAIYVPYMNFIKSTSWSKSSVTKYLASYQPVNNKSIILQKSLLIDVLVYAPWNEFNQLIVENVIKMLQEIPIEDFESTTYKTLHSKNFSNEGELESFMFNNDARGSCMGIVFENSHNTFQYKLRLNDFIKTLEPPVVNDKPSPSQHDVYVERGFAGIQLLLNEEFIRTQINKTGWQLPELEFQGFPQPEYEISSIPRSGFITIASLSIIITSIALSIPFINAVIQEKESGVKELMKLHGVEEWMFWLSWSIHAFIVPAISFTVMIAIFKAPIVNGKVELVRYATFPAVWLLLMLYCLANISFLCMFCAIFHKGIVASFAFIIVLIANFIWIAFYNKLNLQRTVIFVALIPASAFAIAIETVQKYEKLGASFGLKSFSSVFYPVSALIFDTILYSLLTLYISSINPGTFGVPKSPLFFLQYFFTKAKKNSEGAQKLNNTTVKYVERLSSGNKPLILIKSLSKQFESSYAIHGVDLAIYENETIVILGHYGAGKTTFLSILAGLRSYDEGVLHYKGEDLKGKLDVLRTDLGVCFQEDRLFGYLSVRDHLIFYGMLKGLSKDDATREAINNMNIIEIRENEKIKIEAVSLKTKRKLSLAISLLKKPKILILDEPTFGMDFISKRRIWSVLKNLRQNHTIILGTGYAKEAERLADRIAIIQNGTLVTHGTQAYIEKNFGRGYELIITYEKNTDLAPLIELINSLVPDALVIQEKQDEIVFKIDSEKIHKLAKLVKKLEENQKRLKIIHMEIAYATLEQLLSRVQNEALERPKQLLTITEYINTVLHSNMQDTMYLMNLSTQDSNRNLSNSNFQMEKDFSLRMQQIKVLFTVRILYAKRTYLNVFFKLGLPSLILTILLLTMTKIKPKTEMDLSLEEFQNPHILIQKKDAFINVFLYEVLSSFIKERGGVVVLFEENVIEKLIEIGENDKILFGTSLLAAFEFGNDLLKILYNHWELNAIPLAINIYSNIILQYEMKNESRQIKNINKPMPEISEGQCGKKSNQTHQLAILILIFVFFAFYTVDLILYFFEFTSMEIAKRIMHLEIISSVPLWIYWLTTFVFDFIFFTAVIVIRLIMVKYVCDVDLNFMPFSDFHGAFVLMTTLFGISGLLCVYSMSFLFKTTKSMYAIFLVLIALCSISMYIFNQIEGTVLSDDGIIAIHVFYYALKYVILCIPFLNFTLLFNKFLEIWRHNSACDSCEAFMKSACEETLNKLSLWSFPSQENPNGLLLGLSFLFFDIILYTILLSLINMGYIEHWCNLLSTFLLQRADDGQIEEDNDVNREHIRIQNIKKDKSKYDNVTLIADRLSKNYKSFKPASVVENISLIAERGTCFGILGINRSGKTTILKMLAAEISPSKGDISIEGVELNTNKTGYISMIGYCPQTDPLFDEFTGKEVLKIFGLLNGIKRKDIEIMVDDWISIFGLERTHDKNCKFYNHSSKRKLSAAISFIGNPKVIILDEPLSGVDGDAKMKFQEILAQSKKSGTTVILSSVSVDECQKLCDRISILVNGEIPCIGTMNHLKKRYAGGFSIMIKIRRDISSSKSRIILEQNILNAFEHEYCYLKEEHRDLLHYHVKNSSLTWSDSFEKMETVKKNNNIVENYILKNINLKEVFTAFTQPEYVSSKITFHEI